MSSDQQPAGDRRSSAPFDNREPRIPINPNDPRIPPLVRRARWLEKRITEGPPDRPGLSYDTAEYASLMWVFTLTGTGYDSGLQWQNDSCGAGEEPPLRGDYDGAPVAPRPTGPRGPRVTPTRVGLGFGSKSRPPAQPQPYHRPQGYDDAGVPTEPRHSIWVPGGEL